MSTASLYHCNEPAAVVDKVTAPPLQNVVAPAAVMAGVAAMALTVTVSAADVAVHEPLLMRTL